MKKFKSIFIEITNICNLKCSFCSDVKKTKHYISGESFKHILDKIYGHTEYINLHVKGEPLTHPNIYEILELCDKYHLKVNLVTNGTLIKARSQILLESRALRIIHFSLHSLSSQPEYTSHMNDIIEFSKKTLLDTNIHINFRLWNKPVNSAFTEFILDTINNNFNTQIQPQDITYKRKFSINRQLHIHIDDEFKWPELNDPICNLKGFCYGTRTHIGILSDGTVIPCCLDSNGVINLGSIFDQNLSDIIQSERFKNIYRSFSDRKPYEDLCRRCSFMAK